MGKAHCYSFLSCFSIQTHDEFIFCSREILCMIMFSNQSVTIFKVPWTVVQNPGQLSFAHCTNPMNVFHLHLQINKKSNLQALLFKPRVQFPLNDSEEIFSATCAFMVLQQTLNHQPWTWSKLHQMLSLLCICRRHVLPELQSCRWLDCVISQPHRSLQKASLTDLLCLWYFRFIHSKQKSRCYYTV